jgi:hypothetical protein
MLVLGAVIVLVITLVAWRGWRTPGLNEVLAAEAQAVQASQVAVVRAEHAVEIAQVVKVQAEQAEQAALISDDPAQAAQAAQASQAAQVADQQAKQAIVAAGHAVATAQDVKVQAAAAAAKKTRWVDAEKARLRAEAEKARKRADAPPPASSGTWSVTPDYRCRGVVPPGPGVDCSAGRISPYTPNVF